MKVYKLIHLQLISFAFLLGFSAVAWPENIRNTITYHSTVSEDANGPLDLKAEINYNDNVLNAPVAVVMHGFSPSTGNFSNVRNNAKRLRDRGFFAISVALRGRDGSDGERDSGGVEIYDIYDAVEYIKQNYAAFVDESNIHITGYSGGGGNAMSALVKFPDYFRLGSSFYGMSDYGFHPSEGWYQSGAQSDDKAILKNDIGNPNTGGSTIQDRYHARASNLASANNPYSEIHLFVDENEAISPPINSTKFQANAGASHKISVHIGRVSSSHPEAWQDFNNNGNNESNERQRWPHGFPDADEQAAAEQWYIERLLNGQIPEPELAPQADLTVLGFVKTKRFSFWLGDGQNAVATLGYFVDNNSKVFRIREILSNNKSVSGVLTVDTADMSGKAIDVKLNDTVVKTITGGNPYIHSGLKVNDKLELILSNTEPPIFSDNFGGSNNNDGGNDDPDDGGWDLSVDSVMLSDDLLAPNQHYAVTANISNTGTQPSPANSTANNINVKIYISEDDVLETEDIRESDSIERSLMPDESITRCTNVQAYGAGRTGDFSTYVCVLSVSGDADESNDCFSVPTTISTSEPRNDRLCD